MMKCVNIFSFMCSILPLYNWPPIEVLGFVFSVFEHRVQFSKYAITQAVISGMCSQSTLRELYTPLFASSAPGHCLRKHFAKF